MHIISFKTLVAYWKSHSSAEVPLRAWYTQVKHACYQNLADLRRHFPSADQVGRLTVFNIGGNNYRLIARVEYRLQQIYVRHVLTHAEYDKGKWKNDSWNQ